MRNNVKVSLEAKAVTNPGSAYEKYNSLTYFQDFQTYLDNLKKYFNSFIGYGIGINPQKKEKCFEIAQIYANSPAEAEGLAVGDLIFEIDRQKTSLLSFNKFMEMLQSGGEGTYMELGIKSAADERRVSLVKSFIPPTYQRGNQE